MLVPRDRELLQQIVELKGGRLPSFENGFDDGGREQGETQNTAEVGFVDGLCFRKVTNCVVFPRLISSVRADPE